MITKILLRKNEYRDSVFLMVIKERVMQSVSGIQNVAVMMGSQNNQEILRKAGYAGAEITQASANDIVICLQAESDQRAEEAVLVINRTLDQGTGSSSTEREFRTIDSLAHSHPETNFAIISIPGEYAARETSRALKMGMNVLLFSDNVSIVEEREIKSLANSLKRIVMGPDCGSAIINGVPLAFANVIKRGHVGVVAASGTGLQEFSVLLDRAGHGISQAIGTGGRDLYDAVGGISTLKGIDILERDPDTSLITIISKPPQPLTMKKVIERAKNCIKPVVLNMIGFHEDQKLGSNIHVANTFEEAAGLAVTILSGKTLLSTPVASIEDTWLTIAANEASRMSHEQQFIRGLYSGGSLCSEAMLVLEQQVGPVFSNVPLNKEYRVEEGKTGSRHTCVDLGSDEYTRGIPHPMISADLRIQHIRQLAEDSQSAVLLLDVILGYGSHPDMAGALQSSIAYIRSAHRSRGGNLVVIASVCGTDKDPQGLSDQVRKLEDVGVIVMPSNAKAAELAGRIVSNRKCKEAGVGRNS